MDAIEMKKRLEAARERGGAEIDAVVRDMKQKQFASDMRVVRVGLPAMAVAVLGAGVALVYGGADRAATLHAPDPGMLVPGGLFLLVGSYLGALGWAASPPPRDLAVGGLPAKVTVEDYRSAFGSMGIGKRRSARSLDRVAIDLSVAPSEGAPYRATIKQHVSSPDLAAIQIGATFDAFVDRGNPNRILVVFPT